MIAAHVLRLHNITLTLVLFRDTEPWAMNKRNTQKLEETNMRFLRPLLGFNP